MKNNQNNNEVVTVNLTDFVQGVRANHSLQLINLVGTSIAKLLAVKAVSAQSADEKIVDECMECVNRVLKNFMKDALDVLEIENVKNVPDIDMTSIEVNIPVSNIL